MEKKQRQQARFFVFSEVQNEKSKRANRPIMRDMIFLQVINSKNDIACRKVNDQDKRDWPEEWEEFIHSMEYKNFIKNKELQLSYTGLQQLELVESTKMLLKEEGIYSLEQLSECDSDRISHIRGWEQIQGDAQELLGLQRKVIKSEFATTLGQVRGIGPSLVDKLKDRGIYTVEELAQATDERLRGVSTTWAQIRENAKKEIQMMKDNGEKEAA